MLAKLAAMNERLSEARVIKVQNFNSSRAPGYQIEPINLNQAQQRVATELNRLAPILDELSAKFVAVGAELALVGGPVRDMMLGRELKDLDFATSAPPDVTETILKKFSKTNWDVGKAFGTIGCRKAGYDIEITTYRSEKYDPNSRKPEVSYGDSLIGDLQRRDFTINAMAISLPSRELIDPFAGVLALAKAELSTPGTPADSFTDDPLRMLRACRFVSQIGFLPNVAVRTAMQELADRIQIISAERIRDELVKLINGRYPRLGLQLLVETGLAQLVLPELPALALERDEHNSHKDVYEHTLTVLEQSIELEHRLGSGPDFISRFAALMHDVGKPKTRKFLADGTVTFHHHDVVGAKITKKRMQALKFSNEETKAVAKLVELHLRFHGYGKGDWSDAAVRRYVRDAGELLTRLHILTRADCTTRNQRKADRLRKTYDHLEERIERLSAAEELASLRPALDGNQIMQILGLPPGREVGEAYQFLLELRIEQGPSSAVEAEAALRAWAAEREPK